MNTIVAHAAAVAMSAVAIGASAGEVGPGDIQAWAETDATDAAMTDRGPVRLSRGGEPQYSGINEAGLIENPRYRQSTPVGGSMDEPSTAQRRITIVGI